ncbi:MAG: isocitrate/isopropylmalate dehydrogenase family protein [Desulfurococcales archaeon]|nr:isocitrate/isopropylmalate dehydrogenase family protein [Desulfurococcales archaeon]
MKYVLVIPGDGVGPEVVTAALRVLKSVQELYDIDLKLITAHAGDEAARRFGEPLPRKTLELAKQVDAILKGPVGESAADVIVVLRRTLDLYANVRPARSFPGVACVRPTDLVIVRENVEGFYIGAEYRVGDTAIALKVITSGGARRVAKVAAEVAKKRSGRVTIVHKANVLRLTDGLFRDEARSILAASGITADEMYIDAAAMELVRNPGRFDVILTMNQYGDILSDLAAQVSGSLGLTPSANIGDSAAIFESVHGAAWDIAGEGVANPTATILSAAMMLEWLGYAEAAGSMWRAVEEVLSSGIVTPDLGGSATTIEFAEAVASRVRGNG